MKRIGVDLGGTNIAVGVVDESYRIISSAKRKTLCPRRAELIADDMAAAISEAMEKAGILCRDVSFAGIGSPGSVDFENGRVCFAGNLGFENVALAELMHERTGLDFFIENDANAAAYGELIAGAGRGCHDFVMITLGTGVGGGVITGGKIFSGSNHAGSELGHMVICLDGESCTCGRHGCWEAYASATALIRQTKSAMAAHKDCAMWSLCGGDINRVDGSTAFSAAKCGDRTALEIVKCYIGYISVGIVNIVNIFQPQTLCIGGGISNEGDFLLAPIRECLNKENFAKNIKNTTRVTTAELKNDAGIIGAAFLSQLR